MSVEGYYSNARHEIASLLPDKFMSVLEVGCSEGNTLDWLRQTRNVQICCGIEIDHRASQIAREKHLTVVTADLERDGVGFDGQKFDLILCLDVLEHLRDPWSALRDLCRHLSVGGYVIASIPNIAHFSILLDIALRDEWKYEQAGILDFTHLRFFTRKTALRLFTDSGLDIDFVKSRFARKTHRNVNILTMGILRKFLVFQTLIRGREATKISM